MSTEAGTAVEPLILALDIGTSSARAAIYDGRGRLVQHRIARCHYLPETTPDGGVYFAVEFLLGQVVQVLDEILSAVPRPISAVACDTFWHSLLGTDSSGAPLTPLFTWADTRSATAAGELRQRLDEKAIHARTGTLLNSSYWPAKLLWLSQDQASLYSEAAFWMSFGEYLYLRLFGKRRVSISMASGTGLLDQNSCRWDSELLQALPLRENQLSPIADYDETMSGLAEPYRRRWPSLASVPWYMALGDGACNNIGSGGVTAEWLVAMIGTSGALRIVHEAGRAEIPAGLWTYRVDRRRFVVGGALSDGGNVYAWLDQTLRLGSDEEVEAAVAAMKPDAHGLTVLPFLAGERSPHWNSAARAAFVGMGLDTKPVDIVRASLEAVAYRFGLVNAILRRAIPDTKGIIGSGAGLLTSPAWMRIMTDVLGEPLWASTVEEATSRGAALLVLEAMGGIPDLKTVPVPLGTRYDPDSAHTAIYRAAMQRQEELYRLVVPQRDAAANWKPAETFKAREESHEHSD